MPIFNPFPPAKDLRFGNEAARQQAERGRNERNSRKENQRKNERSADIAAASSIGGEHLHRQKGGGSKDMQKRRY
jgi:hypothetical protein